METRGATLHTSMESDLSAWLEVGLINSSGLPSVLKSTIASSATPTSRGFCTVSGFTLIKLIHYGTFVFFFK
jgi:hypothetical protein